ncbi:carbohydrate ABC transporter permease [Streptomyces caniscabiei]|uniref:Carbohydrate ABC transporter permease n=2 Tax=Streptomyces TaxID=1883 RepID=A0A927QJG1_9ACTN|nr:carbohydrate ABC transporter permease [Streptomyces caniscabiei]MBD9729493.1 carbohydrate ABC transporter permease [Streptomyces caniscabiei]MDX3515244.1 carbohydrate ABC transporter permease [Streptomyces caniscabiei]MDX3724439.1 carbohydrate ABC transporter permease [Streptomyces caniscabiei]MDX3732648.1 carbohydrate ABC transporter permease [Streptomyces caniscabiei]WEO28932.1 carbohydrate ABC transporter permease [Streptomyces caniscabiei]
MTRPSIPYIEQTSGRGAARAARRRRGRDHGAARRPGWMTYTVLTVVALISIFPLYYTLLLASSTSAEVAQNPIPSPIPGGHLGDNLVRVFESDIDLPRAVWNSVFVSVTTALAVVFLSTLAGFAFAKLRFKGRAGLLAFVVATMAVPTQLGVVPLFIVMRELGLTGSLWAVIIPGVASAFGVFWMTQYLSAALPYELIEAARIDGASTFRIFRSIVLPAARPALAMLGLFTFIGAWTNFFWPSIVLGTTNPTLPVALQLLQTGFFKDIPLIMTGVLVSVVPLLTLFVILGKQLVAGVMQGALKG